MMSASTSTAIAPKDIHVSIRCCGCGSGGGCYGCSCCSPAKRPLVYQLSPLYFIQHHSDSRFWWFLEGKQKFIFSTSLDPANMIFSSFERNTVSLVSELAWYCYYMIHHCVMHQPCQVWRGSWGVGFDSSDGPSSISDMGWCFPGPRCIIWPW